MAPDGTRAGALPAALASRLLVWLTGVLSAGLLGLSGRAPDFDPAGLTDPFGRAGDLLVAPAARWDAVWFLDVARGGYGHDVAKPAFFPLYPLAVRGLGALTGSSLVAGILLSLVCFAGALVLLERLAVLEVGPEAARAAVWLCALFPMSHFLSAVYSEGLFLLLSVGCVLCARSDRWALAGALGALAAATRSAGVVLLVPLLVLAWEQRRATLRPLLWSLLVPAGLLAVFAGFALTGRPWDAPLSAQDVWYRELGIPFRGVWDGTVAAAEGVRQLLSGQTAHVYFTKAGGDPMLAARLNVMLWLFLLLGVVGAVAVLRRLPLAYGLYVVAALALPLSSPVAPQPLMSLPRFEAVLFPLFLAGGLWLTRPGRAAWVRPVAYALSAAGLVAFAAQFATWHWVA